MYTIDMNDGTTMFNVKIKIIMFKILHTLITNQATVTNFIVQNFGKLHLLEQLSRASKITNMYAGLASKRLNLVLVFITN